MTEEEKKLLILDLSSRLSCGVYIQHPDFDEPQILDTIFNYNAYEGGLIQVASDDIGDKGHSLIDCRPYLRPMYNMTKKEAEEFYKVTGNIFKFYPGCKIYDHIPAFDNDCTEFDTFNDDSEYKRVKPENVIACIDFLNRHHFDYRGLINLGLALEAKEEMYDVN